MCTRSEAAPIGMEETMCEVGFKWHQDNIQRKRDSVFVALMCAMPTGKRLPVDVWKPVEEAIKGAVRYVRAVRDS